MICRICDEKVGTEKWYLSLASLTLDRSTKKYILKFKKCKINETLFEWPSDIVWIIMRWAQACSRNRSATMRCLGQTPKPRGSRRHKLWKKLDKTYETCHKETIQLLSSCFHSCEIKWKKRETHCRTQHNSKHGKPYSIAYLYSSLSKFAAKSNKRFDKLDTWRLNNCGKPVVQAQLSVQSSMHILHHHQFLLLWGTLQNVWSAFIAFSVDGLSVFLPNRSCKAPLLLFVSYLKPEKPQNSLGILLNFSYPSPDLVSVAARSRHPLPGSSSNVSYSCWGAVPTSPWAAAALSQPNYCSYL